VAKLYVIARLAGLPRHVESQRSECTNSQMLFALRMQHSPENFAGLSRMTIWKQWAHRGGARIGRDAHGGYSK
jgi:hypothetical protein